MTYFDVLGAQLEAAAVRLARRRRRRQAGAIAMAVVLAVVGIGAGVAFIDSGRESALASVIEVQQHGELLTVMLREAHAPAEEVLAELDAAGVNARSEPVRTGPSLAGSTLGMHTGSGAAMVPDNGRYRLELAPHDTVVVRVGRDDGIGPYDIPSDAFAPGEPLACSAWPGQLATDLARQAALVDVTVRFLDTDGRAVNDLTGLVVERAEAHGPADVVAIAVEREATTGEATGANC